MADEAALSALAVRQASIEARLLEHADALAAVRAANDSSLTLPSLAVLTAMHATRERLENAAYYLGHLETVATAVQRAKGKDGQASLAVLYDAYVDLAEVTSALTREAGGRDRGVANVVTRAERAKRDIFGRMESLASGSLRQVLADMDWPHAAFDASDTAPFVAAMRDCLAVYTAAESLPAVLAPFAVLAEAIGVRFDYHFNAARPTNRLDRPEWPLRHLLAVLTDRRALMPDVVQPILDAIDLPSHAAEPLDALQELARAIVPLAARKLQATAASILHLNDDSFFPPDAPAGAGAGVAADDTAASLLSHLISESNAFDDALRTDFGLQRERDGSAWRGATGAVLADDVYTAWLDSEAAFAAARFAKVAETVGAWELDEELDLPPSAIYEDDGDGNDDYGGGSAATAGSQADSAREGRSEVLPNAACVAVIQLLESVAGRFERVVSTLQGRRFFDRITRATLARYLARVRESTDAFEQLGPGGGLSGGFPLGAASGEVGIGGAAGDTEVAGVAGARRLCRQYASIHHVLARMRGWNEDAFYVRVGGDSYTGAGAFDGLEDEYAALKDRIWRLLGTHVVRELTRELRPYGRVQTWSSDQVPQSNLATTTAVSVQLIKVFETARGHFAYLSGVLGGRRTRALYAETVAPAVEGFVLDGVLLGNRFSSRGRLQFTRDVWELWATFAPFVRDPRAPMRRLSLAVQVFGASTAADGEAAVKEPEPRTAAERDFVGVLRGRLIA